MVRGCPSGTTTMRTNAGHARAERRVDRLAGRPPRAAAAPRADPRVVEPPRCSISSAIDVRLAERGHEHRVDRQLGVGDLPRCLRTSSSPDAHPHEPAGDGEPLEPDVARERDVQREEEGGDRGEWPEGDPEHEQRREPAQPRNLPSRDNAPRRVVRRAFGERARSAARVLGPERAQERTTEIPLGRRVQEQLALPARRLADRTLDLVARTLRARDEHRLAEGADRHPVRLCECVDVDTQTVDQRHVRRGLAQIAERHAPDRRQAPVQVDPAHDPACGQELAEPSPGAPGLGECQVELITRDEPALEQLLTEQPRLRLGGYERETWPLLLRGRLRTVDDPQRRRLWARCCSWVRSGRHVRWFIGRRSPGWATPFGGSGCPAYPPCALTETGCHSFQVARRDS